MSQEDAIVPRGHDASSPPDDSVLAALKSFGADAISFTAVESEMRHWFDTESGACVAYVDTGSAWVGAGAPLAPAEDVTRIAQRFVAAARAARRRASFFATETFRSAEFTSLLIGEQPIFRPSEWLRMGKRSLREQVRRARAKGVTVRCVEPSELREGSHLRDQIERRTAEWLGSRHMQPMGFVVAVEPFHHPAEHRYFVAEREGELLEFLSAVPIYGRDGWLVEDVVRGQPAPNGTTELLLDAFFRHVEPSAMVTLGLSPLSGGVTWPLRLARVAMRPLFDFAGLRAFRQRLRPGSWEPVYLVVPRSDVALVHLVDALRAFARGSLIRFGVTSLVEHPSGPPWLLALPLIPWCLTLAAIGLSGNSGWLGFSEVQMGAWVAFDAVLAFALYDAALQPRLGSLLPVAALASVDAVLSLHHAVATGFGPTWVDALLRFAAVAAPCAGTLVLAWACLRAAKRPR